MTGSTLAFGEGPATRFWRMAHVRYWNLADIDADAEHVRFWG
jgi:hypothetical protein